MEKSPNGSAIKVQGNKISGKKAQYMYTGVYHGSKIPKPVKSNKKQLF